LISRGVYPPAHEYVKHADRSHLTLVEVFRNLHVDDEEPLENGDADHEVHSAYIFYITSSGKCLWSFLMQITPYFCIARHVKLGLL
jgi:hypothetical protein